jgi:hypothetical protein
VAKDRKQAALDALDQDIAAHKNAAWAIAEGNPDLEALYRAEVGDPPR